MAILSNVAKSGWLELLHHLLTVQADFPICSASHLPVFCCSTSTTLIRLRFALFPNIYFTSKSNKNIWKEKGLYWFILFFLKKQWLLLLILGYSIYFLGYFYVISWVQNLSYLESEKYLVHYIICFFELSTHLHRNHNQLWIKML